MSLRFVFNSGIPKFLRVEAITLYPYVFCRRSFETTSWAVIRHEYEHILQVRRLGLFKFYTSYLLEYFKHLIAYRSHFKAYYAISFEKEARRAEGDHWPEELKDLLPQVRQT